MHLVDTRVLMGVIFFFLGEKELRRFVHKFLVYNMEIPFECCVAMKFREQKTGFAHR